MTGPWNELTIFGFASPLELCHIVVLPLIILSLVIFVVVLQAVN